MNNITVYGRVSKISDNGKFFTVADNSTKDDTIFWDVYVRESKLLEYIKKGDRIVIAGTAIVKLNKVGEKTYLGAKLFPTNINFVETKKK